MKRVHVAVGVVINPQGFILVSKRPDHVHQGGLWEFPGGKVEPDENVQQALTRELSEELAVAVIRSESLIAIEHDYSDKSVLLDVWWVDAFSGDPHGREGQLWQWIAVGELRGLEFPAANKPIIDAIEAKVYSRSGASSERKLSESKSS